MVHLINKSALVAEIEKLKYVIMPYPTMAEKVAYRDGIEDTIKIVIKSLEVKEVDLEKYYHDFLQKEWFDKDKDCTRTFSEMMTFTAKHFFELGLKVQKGE